MDAFKKAEVRPLYKKDERTEKPNLLVNILSKFKKAIKEIYMNKFILILRKYFLVTMWVS